MTPTIEEMTARLRERAPYKTGTYRRTIMWERDASGWTAGTESALGKWLEFGTGIKGEVPTKMYEIKPRYKKALRWQRDITSIVAFYPWFRGRVGVQHIVQTNFVRSSGAKTLSWWTSKKSKTQTDVFAQRVMHPGIKAMPHFRPTFEEFKPIIHDRLAAMFRALVARSGYIQTGKTRRDA
jgi:hypothetical protein